MLFNSPLDLLFKTLESALSAIKVARENKVLGDVSFKVIDNSKDLDYSNQVRGVIQSLDLTEICDLKFEESPKNRGYGITHNQAILSVESDIHLVLNPDVELRETSIYHCISALLNNSNIVLVSPIAFSIRGERLSLCKRYPSVLALGLRGIAFQPSKKLFQSILDKYEMLDLVGIDDKVSVPFVSGCFMLCKTQALQSIGGFSEKFFMYFEDFDLSLRLREIGDIVSHPSVKIVHHGGNVSKKGIRHICFFVYSGIRFFNRHGWRFI